MNTKLISAFIAVLFAICMTACSQPDIDVIFKANNSITIAIDNSEESVTRIATEMFANDYQAVFDVKPTIVDGKKGDILVGTIGIAKWASKYVSAADIEELESNEEAFLLTVAQGKIIVLGSDKRGTAYGILELSREIGVSPWVWWADSKPEKKADLVMSEEYHNLQYPSVPRRGIFINDEDWGLMPWSSTVFEPSTVKGEIGPKTNARIFELLLRLRANTYWPAMHKCSVAFFQTPGNKEMADKYGIFVGSSHCEPMARNTYAEWNRKERGRYNYLTNKESILSFWEERVKELAKSDNIYTLGLRGEHDGKMEGAKSDQERKEVLAQVMADQRKMLAEYVNPNVEEISQVFIPYKEVLDAYRLGLEVPEDVTLMWCDDNYGYVRHFPTSEEAARKGGNGLYYHISYWGRPHDYLWLATNSPAQIYSQMKLSYDKGNRDMWVLNVGDIKPGEYLTEFFMDMAWNINFIGGNKQGLDQHLHHWLAREFGEDKASELTAVMNEYYRLAYIRKPEYMGNTRTEERTKPHWNIVSDLAWSEKRIRERIADYQKIWEAVDVLSKTVDSRILSSWFELVEYPVKASAEMNFKHLYGQLARHGMEDWAMSDNAYDNIVELTQKYNILEDGKWNKIMSMRPRDLVVYDKVKRSTVKTPLVKDEQPLALFNGVDYNKHLGTTPIETGLGYKRGAIYIDKGSSVSFELDIEKEKVIDVIAALAPNHPVDGKNIRYSISVDGDQAQEVAYQTKGRSEEWKENVLSNQAIRKTTHKLAKKLTHTITITALDEGVVLDQIRVEGK